MPMAAALKSSVGALLVAFAAQVCGAQEGAALVDVRVSDLRSQGGPASVRGRPAWSQSIKGGFDLTVQFSDASNRNQRDLGSCHAFAAIALLEAAYYRQHNEHVRLSEADIFLNRVVLGEHGFLDDLTNSDPGTRLLAEGGDPAVDIRFALEHGVATDLYYHSFLDRYRAYRESVQADMAFVNRIDKMYQQEIGEDGKYWLAPLFSRFLESPREFYLGGMHEPAAQKALRGYMEGPDRRLLDSGRAQMKRAFAGFRLLSRDFPYFGEAVPPAQCRNLGAGQGKTILEELAAQRPVAVRMTLKGLAAWGLESGSNSAGNHSFAIIGARRESGGGEVLFQTRNSWGGVNPNVSESELCRVYSIVTVRVPDDH